MLALFSYNWQVRNDWFEWCKTIPQDELLKERIGGVGSILHTLFHITDVEYSWIQLLQGKPEFTEPFESYKKLEQVKLLSDTLHEEVEVFLRTWTNEMDQQILVLQSENGKPSTYIFGEIVRHMIAHEIHHVGQLSVWARALHVQPVSANLFGRQLPPLG